MKMEIDQCDFRRALGAFPTGVTIVTTRESDGTPRGFTASSFTSVSLDPPMVLVCVAKAAASAQVFAAADGFVVTVLSRAQKAVSALFASKASDKFVRADWDEGGRGLPLIRGGVAWFQCVREQAIDAGDHAILLGRVETYGHTPEEPLGYCRGAYVDFALAQRAMSALGGSTRVEALLEQDGCLLLRRRADGAFALPGGVRLDPATDPHSLRGVLAGYGVVAHLDFLFAVFEGPGADDAVTVVYRGSATSAADASVLELVPFARVLSEPLADGATRSMIRRFLREREAGFGIYVGDAETGTVQSLAKEAV